MSHIAKLILRITMERVCSRIRPEIWIEQCDFVEDTATRNTVFMVRMISERANEKQRDVYMCFIDYTKAFDRIQLDEFLNMVMNLDLYGKDIHLSDLEPVLGPISLYKNREWDEWICQNQKRSMSRMCLVTYLFNLYLGMILWETEDQKGFIIGGQNINNLRYADDTVLIAKSEKRLQDLLDKVVEESKKKGLTINYKKTECMVVSKREGQACALKIRDNTIKQVKRFNYLGSLLRENGKCDEEIKKRTRMAKDTFQKLQKIVKNSKISLDIRKWILDFHVKLILKIWYWQLDNILTHRAKATRSRNVILWKDAKISWTHLMSNKEELRRE